jgi:glycerophosphoryl diester phosphodiesterase
LQRAIEEGADFIEADILASKDGVLICHHDVTLDNTTDIANHPEFANRKTTYVVQGVNTTGWFVGIKENSYISSVSHVPAILFFLFSFFFFFFFFFFF